MNSYFRQQRLQHPADKIRRRGRRVIGTAAHFNTRRSIGKPQRGQHRLQHQRTTSCATDSKAIIAATHGAGPEDQTLRPQLRAFHRRPANFRRRLYRRQMLAQQSRFCRPARMPVMVNGWPVIIDRLSAERMICPPPSPCAPSSAIILFIIYPFTHTT